MDIPVTEQQMKRADLPKAQQPFFIKREENDETDRMASITDLAAVQIQTRNNSRRSEQKIPLEKQQCFFIKRTPDDEIDGMASITDLMAVERKKQNKIERVEAKIPIGSQQAFRIKPGPDDEIDGVGSITDLVAMQVDTKNIKERGKNSQRDEVEALVESQNPSCLKQGPDDMVDGMASMIDVTAKQMQTKKNSDGGNTNKQKMLETQQNFCIKRESDGIDGMASISDLVAMQMQTRNNSGNTKMLETQQNFCIKRESDGVDGMASISDLVAIQMQTRNNSENSKRSEAKRRFVLEAQQPFCIKRGPDDGIDGMASITDLVTNNLKCSAKRAFFTTKEEPFYVKPAANKFDAITSISELENMNNSIDFRYESSSTWEDGMKSAVDLETSYVLSQSNFGVIMESESFSESSNATNSFHDDKTSSTDSPATKEKSANPLWNAIFKEIDEYIDDNTDEDIEPISNSEFEFFNKKNERTCNLMDGRLSKSENQRGRKHENSKDEIMSVMDHHCLTGEFNNLFAEKGENDMSNLWQSFNNNWDYAMSKPQEKSWLAPNDRDAATKSNRRCSFDDNWDNMMRKLSERGIPASSEDVIFRNHARVTSRRRSSTVGNEKNQPWERRIMTKSEY